MAEAHTAVGDRDQVLINSRLQGFNALSAGSRDLVQRCSAVERRGEEPGTRVGGEVAQPACEGALEPSCQGGGPGRKLLTRSRHAASQLDERQWVPRRFSKHPGAEDRMERRRRLI